MTTASTANVPTSTNLIKPPDFITCKEDYPSYKRRLERWSRSCGVAKEKQGDIILMYAGKNQIADMLDREIGDTIVDNEEGVKTILDKLEGWYGKENSVLYQSFR